MVEGCLKLTLMGVALLLVEAEGRRLKQLGLSRLLVVHRRQAVFNSLDVVPSSHLILILSTASPRMASVVSDASVRSFLIFQVVSSLLKMKDQTVIRYRPSQNQTWMSFELG